MYGVKLKRGHALWRMWNIRTYIENKFQISCFNLCMHKLYIVKIFFFKVDLYLFEKFSMNLKYSY